MKNIQGIILASLLLVSCTAPPPAQTAAPAPSRPTSLPATPVMPTGFNPVATPTAFPFLRPKDTSITINTIDRLAEIKTMQYEGISRLSPNGQVFATVSSVYDRRNQIDLWSINAENIMRSFEGDNGNFKSLSFSRNGELLAAGSGTLGSGREGAAVWIWEISTGKLLKTLTGQVDDILSLSFSPNSETLSNGSAKDKGINIWNISKGSIITYLHGHTDMVRTLAFSPDGQLFASGSNDDTIRLWRTSDGAKFPTLVKHKANIIGVEFSPDGQRLASLGEDNTVWLWGLPDGTPLGSRVLNVRSLSMAFSPSNEILAIGCEDGIIRFLRLNDLSTIKELEVIKANSFDNNVPKDMQIFRSRISSIEFSSDGTVMSVSDGQNKLHIFGIK